MKRKELKEYSAGTKLKAAVKHESPYGRKGWTVTTMFIKFDGQVWRTTYKTERPVELKNILYWEEV